MIQRQLTISEKINLLNDYSEFGLNYVKNKYKVSIKTIKRYKNNEENIRKSSKNKTKFKQ